MKKLNTKSGFTLAELLIVVAIIAILVAIGIPVFSTAMERSRETVDLANIRAAYAEFQSGQLTSSGIKGGVYKIDFKQTDGSGWLVDNTSLKNLLSNDSELDSPQTAGSTKDAVKFTVSGTGKPKLEFVTYGTNAKIVLTDKGTKDATTGYYTFDEDSTYYLYEE